MKVEISVLFIHFVFKMKKKNVQYFDTLGLFIHVIKSVLTFFSDLKTEDRTLDRFLKTNWNFIWKKQNFSKLLKAIFSKALLNDIIVLGCI